MRAVVSHGVVGEQTICLIKGGELSIEVSSLDGGTLHFVVLDRQTTIEVMDLLIDEFGIEGQS